MFLADQTHDYRALLDSFLCVLDLEYPPLWGAAKVSMSVNCMQARSSVHSQCDRIVVVIISEHTGCFLIWNDALWELKGRMR